MRAAPRLRIHFRLAFWLCRSPGHRPARGISTASVASGMRSVGAAVSSASALARPRAGSAARTCPGFRYSLGSAAQARSCGGRCPVVRNAVTASFAHVLAPNG